jgi:hypothetical protein
MQDGTRTDSRAFWTGISRTLSRQDTEAQNLLFLRGAFILLISKSFQKTSHRKIFQGLEIEWRVNRLEDSGFEITGF